MRMRMNILCLVLWQGKQFLNPSLRTKTQTPTTQQFPGILPIPMIQNSGYYHKENISPTDDKKERNKNTSPTPRRLSLLFFLPPYETATPCGV